MKSMITEAALAMSRSVELSILLKATLMLVMGLAATQLAGRIRASRRHLLLAATFFTLFALPLIVVAVPGVTIELPAPHASESGKVFIRSDALMPPTSDSLMPGMPEGSHWSMPTWPAIVRSGWAAGALLMLAWLALDILRLRRLSREGLPWLELRGLTRSLAAECGIRRPVEVLLHEGITAPLTCGARQPVILLPPDARAWGDADLRRALIHELEHIRRCDWVVQLAARVMCACYWFHPLIWEAWRRLCFEAERACDDAVVRSAAPTEYAEQLVSLAGRLRKGHAQQAPGVAKRSDLSRRVSALLDGSQRRGRAGLLTILGVVCVAGLVAAAIAPVRAVAQFNTPTAPANQESGPPTGEGRARRSSPLDRALYEAAEAGDTSEISRLLDAGADVNCTINGDGSPLIGAARRGRTAAVQLLLDRGADPNMPVRGDGNPLIMAAREGHGDVVALLLDRGAVVDQVVPDDENALIQASGEGHLDVVKLLVARGADVNARVWVERTGGRPNGEWRSPLGMARRGRHDAVVAYLLSTGARE
jgi:beta-lactamase regulating signal transducer with metallopeptidase domain